MAENQSVMVKNRAGELVDITNAEIFARTVMEIIHNHELRSVLLGTHIKITDIDRLVNSALANLLGGEIGYIYIMRRIINFVFITAITRWKQSLDDKDGWTYPETYEEFENSRYSKIFQSVLSKEDITLDLQIFALIELWVGIKKSNNDDIRSQFANIFSNKRKGENLGLILQAARDAIKNATYKSLDSGKYTIPYCVNLCYNLITSFPFLREVKITYPTDASSNDKHAFSISYPLPLDVSEDGSPAVLYPNDFYDHKNFVITDEQLRYLKIKNQESDESEKIEAPVKLQLYLLCEVSAFANELQYIYRSFDDQYAERVYGNEDASDDFFKVDVEKIQEMRKFLSFNYRNIRELAIIISDSIKNSPAKKKEIFDLCKKRNSKAMPTNVQSPTDSEIYWDNVITLMLVEMGPSDFLEFVIDEQDAYKQSIYDDIMDNIEWRYAEHDDIRKTREECDKEFQELEAKYANSSTKKGFPGAAVSLRARKILQVMGIKMEENHGKSSFEEDLAFKFETIENCVNMLIKIHEDPGAVDNAAEKKKKARLTLIETFRNIFIFLQVFYTALDEYAKKKQEQEARPINFEISEEKRRKDLRTELNDTFTDSATGAYENIYNQTLSEAFEAFCALCRNYNAFDTAGSMNVSAEAKRLKYLITRNYICDEKKLRYFVTIDLGDGKKSTILDMLETYNAEYVEHSEFSKWHTYFFDLFLFLIYNEDYYDHGLYLKKDVLEDKDFDPIYPYLVTYYKENTDRDNFKRCIYRVPIPTGKKDNYREQGYVVTLLTEQELIGKSYFCIPLRYGATDKWWINPLMIPMHPIRRMKDRLRQKNITLK